MGRCHRDNEAGKDAREWVWKKRKHSCLLAFSYVGLASPWPLALMFFSNQGQSWDPLQLIYLEAFILPNDNLMKIKCLPISLYYVTYMFLEIFWHRFFSKKINCYSGDNVMSRSYYVDDQPSLDSLHRPVTSQSRPDNMFKTVKGGYMLDFHAGVYSDDKCCYKNIWLTASTAVCSETGRENTLFKCLIFHHLQASDHTGTRARMTCTETKPWNPPTYGSLFESFALSL